MSQVSKMKSKIIMGVAVSIVLISTLSQSFNAHAQAISAVSNPPQQVYVDPQPSTLDPDYPGQRVALHSHLKHHHAVSNDGATSSEQNTQH